LRNLNLFNMESMYEIRMDMEEHLPRLQPYVGENDEVKFSGWSRMAQPVSNFELVEVREMRLGYVLLQEWMEVIPTAMGSICIRMPSRCMTT
jgi:intron-binding protein aquarius